MTNILWISYSGFSHPDNCIPLQGPVGVLTHLRRTKGVDGIVYNLNDPFLYGFPENPHVPTQEELNAKIEELIGIYQPDMIFATGWMNEYLPLIRTLGHAKKFMPKIGLIINQF